MSVTRTLANSREWATSASVHERDGRLDRYRLEPLTPDEASRWDKLIARYESTQLFHRKVWLDYLAASRGVNIRMWAIRGDDRTIGYLCGGVVRKGPFRVFGSPLKGWGTNFMGPVVDRDFDQRAFLRALDQLAVTERFAMVEIENPVLSDDQLSAFGYTPVVQPTFVVTLTPGEPEKMWSRLERRTQVRKAQKSGLTVEEADEGAIADEFYDQFQDLMVRKGLHPPYDRGSPRLLFELLKPQGMLLALRVRSPEGQVLAVGLFPHDGHTLYFWGGASRPEAKEYRPNDLLHWTAMEMGAARGLGVYNMCGNGFFKKKFGGVIQEPKRWHKCYSRTARWGRHAYERYFQLRILLQGLWRRLLRSRSTG